MNTIPVECGVYRIELGNDNFYIGSSRDMKSREYEHKYRLQKKIHDNSRAQKCWDKYGVFDFIVLETCAEEYLQKLEQDYLDEDFDNPKNINILPEAYRTTGYKHTDETREKMSKLQTGRVVSEETRELLRSSPASISAHEKNRGVPISEERRRRLIESNTGRKCSKETRQKISQKITGTVKSDSTRRKTSQTLKKSPKAIAQRARLHSTPQSEITRERRRESALKRPPVSEATREKLRVARLSYLAKKREAA